MRAHEWSAFALLLAGALIGCQQTEGEIADLDATLGGASSRSDGAERSDVAAVDCERDAECSDGVFCNGQETCTEGKCQQAEPPICDDGIECTRDFCSHERNTCVFEAPDADGDGYRDASCQGPDGASLGADCDDRDPERFPGNFEVCSPTNPNHDEDCDPSTFGFLDVDADGEIDSVCCNEEPGGALNCGTDCNDQEFRQNSSYPEICDEIDNDCDGEVDVNATPVQWYPDSDGDQFGEDGEFVLSCAPVEGYAVGKTDCDDSSAAVHSAALEICDGFDNDCDGEVDEDNVCACAPEGISQACACDESKTGVRSCVGGWWGSCDCRECVTGSVDCLGNLLPRSCIAGRWVVQNACTGARPLCSAGECICADGSVECAELEDVFPPNAIAYAPNLLINNTLVPRDTAIDIAFSEDLDPASVVAAQIRVVANNGEEIAIDIQHGGPQMRVVPREVLPVAQSFILEIPATLTDLAGNPLSAPQKKRFRTATGATGTSFEEVLNLPNLGNLDLDVSAQGEAMLLGMEVDGTFTERFSLSYDEDVWGSRSLVYERTDRGPLSIDDAGNAFTAFTVGSAVYRADWTSTTGSWIDGLDALSTSAVPGAEPLLDSTSDGLGVHVYREFGDLVVDLRVGGTWERGASTTLAQGTKRQLKVNENAAISVGSIVGGQLEIWRSGQNAENWKRASVGPTSGNVLDFSMALGADNILNLAWSVELPTDEGSGVLPQVFFQRLDVGGQWLGPAEAVSPDGNTKTEATPVLAAFAQSDVHLAWTGASGELSVRTRIEGSWS
ncbi:MAG: Ig-like domain-containing protein, partial [Polyangiaceae bacterium]|nr:Ig-like domain-containing protein [Polyangiaceae bacterium]